MKTIIQNPETGIFRAGWRITIFIVLMVSFASGLMVGVSLIFGEFKEDSNLQLYLLTIAVTLAVLISRHYLDKRSFKSLGLQWGKKALVDFLVGTTLGALALSCIFLIMLFTDAIEFHGFKWWGDEVQTNGELQLVVLAPIVLATIFRYLSTVWWEELVFRGYIFQNIVEGLGLRWAVIMSCLFFGGLHYLAPSATVLSSLLIVFATPMFIFAYLKTGQLWLPMGLHFGWNFFQTSIYGYGAGTRGGPPNLISQSPVGPEWLSGGNFGVEGSVYLVPFVVLVMISIHYWARLTRNKNQGFLEFEAHNKA